MKVQKVFQTSQKKISIKPAFIKPRHKTYRQLLDLDRPKRALKVQSDDQNDDFLQKLLKLQEKKQKQQKQNKKKPKSKSSLSKRSQGQSLSPGIKKSFPIQNKNLVQAPQKQQPTQLKQNIRLQTEQLIFGDQKLPIQTSIIITVEQPDKTRFTMQSLVIKRPKTQKKQQKQTLPERKQIFIDQTSYQFMNVIRESQQYVKHKLTTNIKPRQGTSLKILQKQVHQLNKFSQSNKFSQVHQYNPQKKQIQHLIKTNINKSGSSISAEQKMNNVIWRNCTLDGFINKIANYTSRQPMHKTFSFKGQSSKLKGSLFRNTYQEQIFKKSLHNH